MLLFNYAKRCKIASFFSLNQRHHLTSVTGGVNKIKYRGEKIHWYYMIMTRACLPPSIAHPCSCRSARQPLDKDAGSRTRTSSLQTKSHNPARAFIHNTFLFLLSTRRRSARLFATPLVKLIAVS